MLLMSYEEIEEAMKELARVKKELEEMETKNKLLTKQNKVLKEKVKKYLHEKLLDRRKIKMYKAHIYATMLKDTMENDAVLKSIELNAYVGNKGYDEMLEKYHRNKSTEIVCQIEGISTTFDRIAESGRINHAAEIYENILDKNKENVKETIDELEKSGMIDLALKII